MRFITRKNSDTGKKFQALEDEFEKCFQAQVALSEELGFESWRDAYWHKGGISAVIFTTPPDKALWKNVNGSRREWLPKRNTKAGSELGKKFDILPKVALSELNKCIGFRSNMNSIGLATQNDEYFGIMAKDEWEIIIPTDCEEVTVTRFNQLFKKD